MRNPLRCLLALLALAVTMAAAEPPQRYALILRDPAVARTTAMHESLASVTAVTQRQKILAAQTTLKTELARRSIPVTGSVQTVMNAVFVKAAPSRVQELLALPGVAGIAPLHRFRLHLNKAVQLQNVPAAWQALGGTGNAGAGVKVAVLDTGIDPNHPAFQDSSLSVPEGFPKCTDGVPSDCNFTNHKIIVARSYVAELASGSLSADGVSRPDDVSPRDHIGHGTAVSSVVAGVPNTGPTGVTITGMAPKAWLGMYKVFGSPGVNDYTGGDVLIRAIEDAVNDGMDIAVMSLGSASLTGPLDTGAICGLPNGAQNYCDPEAQAVEAAVAHGMLVVASAGNSGDSGLNTWSYNTVESPAAAPSALAVGASTNSHEFDTGFQVIGTDVPSSLSFVAASFTDGPTPASEITASAIDATSLESTGQACSAYAANAMKGSVALINRGNCNFSTKVANAQNAGAVAVVLVDNVNEDLFTPTGMSGALIPSELISLNSGTALRTYLAAHSGAKLKLNNSVGEVPLSTYNTLASFSSRGPSITYLAKPEVVGVGTNVYMATQKYDATGEMYDASGYLAASGTSFSAPTLAGIAALVKQKNPAFTPAQLKSAVVGTATQDITDGGTAAVTAVGDGKVNAGSAVATTVTTDPATVSFGAIGQTTNLPVTQTLKVHCTTTATLTFAATGTGTLPAIAPGSLSCAAGGADQTVTLTLSGSTPKAGLYQGAITVTGGAVPVRVPYLYAVGDGVPDDMVAIMGGFDAAAGSSPGGVAVKLIDQYGVAVPNSTVTFKSNRGLISPASVKTDEHGVAYADVQLASGSQTFYADSSALNNGFSFAGVGRRTPTITTGGAVNAASFQVGAGLVPGSYISIFGTWLSDTMGNAPAVPLPLGLSQTSVSFEVPSANISLPGSMLYADPNQINVQVPWGLQGQTEVQIRVNVGMTSGQAYTAKIAQYSPAVFVADSANNAAAQDESFAAVTSSNAVVRGHYVHLYANGLGAVDHTPVTGEAASGSTFSRATTLPTVTIGGKSASVSYAGLAPGFPGLFQIDCQVPIDAAVGQDAVIVKMGDVSAPTAYLYVK